jgi:hypothetical protein
MGALDPRGRHGALEFHSGERGGKGTVKMQVPEATGRTFKVKVTRFVPNQEMVWRDGTQ